MIRRVVIVVIVACVAALLFMDIPLTLVPPHTNIVCPVI